jgi:hypothetical protein
MIAFVLEESSDARAVSATAALVAHIDHQVAVDLAGTHHQRVVEMVLSTKAVANPAFSRVEGQSTSGPEPAR